VRGGARATVCCDSTADTWETLAPEIKLDEDEYYLWAKTEGGGPVGSNPLLGQTYTVPNKVIVDIGGTKWGKWGAFKDQYHYKHFTRVARAMGRKLAAAGYLVESHTWGIPNSVAPDPIFGHLRDMDLYAYIYAGHGLKSGKGSLVYAYDAKGSYATPLIGKVVHHRLALIVLLTCYSLDASGRNETAYDPSTTRGRTGSVFSDWELNVSRHGELIGFGSSAYIWSEAEHRQGGLGEATESPVNPSLPPQFVSQFSGD